MEASNEVIISIVLVYHRSPFVLFVLRSILSYLPTYFSTGFDVAYDTLYMSFHESTIVGESLIVD